MKKLPFFLLLSGIFLACNKENPIDPVEPTPTIDTTTHIIELGKGGLLRNGVSWNAIYSARYYATDFSRFNILAKLTESGYLHTFSIGDIKTIPGIYHFERSFLWNDNNGIPEALYFVVLDGDQLFNSYNVDSTRTNQFIEILRYDSVEHIVEGRFQTFLEGPNSWSFLPDSMAITEGKFHLKIQ